jgi:signal peptidase II
MLMLQVGASHHSRDTVQSTNLRPFQAGRRDTLQKVRDYLMLLGISGAIIALDQWTKYLVRSNLLYGETWSPWEWLAPIARIVHWNNTGAAFGIFPAGGVIFTIVAIVVSAAILYYYPQVPREQIGVRIALPMQLGGALGNLIDRLTIGTVTDFVSIGPVPVFNVADACITVGVAVLIVVMWIDERRRRREDAAQDVRVNAEEEASENPENQVG